MEVDEGMGREEKGEESGENFGGGRGEEVGRVAKALGVKVRGPEADVGLEAEQGVKVAEVDSGKRGLELGEELGGEEVELPAGGAKERGGDTKEDAAGMLLKGVTGRV
jgi:hypothetical protein